LKDNLKFCTTAVEGDIFNKPTEPKARNNNYCMGCTKQPHSGREKLHRNTLSGQCSGQYITVFAKELCLCARDFQSTARAQVEINRFPGKVNIMVSSAVYLVETEWNHLFKPSHWKLETSMITGGFNGR
jgi:hypothetical protein